MIGKQSLITNQNSTKARKAFFLGRISHSLRSHVTLTQVLHDMSGCEGDSRRTIRDKTTSKKFLRVGGSMGLISRGWGLMKHLKFKTEGILLERGVQFNRKGGLV